MEKNTLTRDNVQTVVALFRFLSFRDNFLCSEDNLGETEESDYDAIMSSEEYSDAFHQTQIEEDGTVTWVDHAVIDFKCSYDFLEHNFAQGLDSYTLQVLCSCYRDFGALTHEQQYNEFADASRRMNEIQGILGSKLDGTFVEPKVEETGSFLVDCRCPHCNSLVRGRQDVAIERSLVSYPKVMACPSCARAVKLVEVLPNENDHLSVMMARNGSKHYCYSSEVSLEDIQSDLIAF